MKQIILSYEFVLVFFVCFIIFLLISIFIKRQIIKNITLLLFSVFFVLFFFELILSFFMEKIDEDFIPDFYLCSDNEQLHKYREIKIRSKIDGNIKYVKTEDYDVGLYEKIYDVIYSYNVIFSLNGYIGFRYVKCNSFSTDTYIFLGCSFTNGDGLDDEETLPYYFSKIYDFNKNVINCGVRSHGSNTALNILNNEIFLSLMDKKSNIKHCFYSLIGEHINRNFRILCNDDSTDCYILKNKKYFIVNPIVKFKFLFARSYIFRKVFVLLIDDYFKKYYEDYMIKSLEEMNRIVEKKYKSKLTIIVWDKKNYSRYFIEKLKETGLDLIWLPDYFTPNDGVYKIKYDGHPTAKANEEIAEILYNHIKDKTN